MNIRSFRLFGTKAAAFAAILAVPFVALAGDHVDFKPSAPLPEEFVPESPTIVAGILLLLPLAGSAIRILYKNRAARRHIDSAP